MSLLNLFIDLATKIPGDTSIENTIDSQHVNIRDAIKSNDNTRLKQFISDKQNYANEVHVAVY